MSGTRWLRRLALLSLALMTGSAAAAEREVLLYVSAAPSAWHDQQLGRHLVTRFSRSPYWRPRLLTPDVSEAPLSAMAMTDIDSLAAWGREQGGRFILAVRVESERIENRRTFNLPMVFQRYEAVGVIEAELRLIDAQRERLLWAGPLTVELKGPRIFQGHPDDDRYDADIHIAAPEKLAFMSRLEKRFADKVFERVERAMRHRR